MTWQVEVLELDRPKEISTPYRYRVPGIGEWELGRASIDRVQARLKSAVDKGLSTSVKFQDAATPDDQYRWTPADHRRRGFSA